MINVQHRALSAFEQNRITRIHRLIHQHRGVDNHGLHALRCSSDGSHRRLHIQRVLAIEFQKFVVLDHIRFEAFEKIRLQDLSRPEAGAVHFVHICRTNAAFGGADFHRRLVVAALTGTIKSLVMGQRKLGPVGNPQPVGGIDSAFPYFVQFNQETFGVNHAAVAEDAGFPLTQDPAGNKMQDVFAVAHFHRVTGVVAPLKTCNPVCTLREHVYNFSFPFISPLSANQHSGCHRFCLVCRSAIKRAGSTWRPTQTKTLMYSKPRLRSMVNWWGVSARKTRLEPVDIDGAFLNASYPSPLLPFVLVLIFVSCLLQE